MANKMLAPNTTIWWLPIANTRTVTDGATTSASTTVSSATANFGSADVGSPISGTGIPAGATIVTVTNATTVVISSAATATGTNVSLTIGISWNPTSPSAALLTDARNISCSIDNGYKLGPTAPETDKSKSICESANVENRVAYTYEGALTFFREGDLTDNTSAYARAFSFFKSGTQNGQNLGWLVRRVGYKNTVAAAAGQQVESYLFVPDNPKDEVADKTTIKYSVTFKQQGDMALFVPLAA